MFTFCPKDLFPKKLKIQIFFRLKQRSLSISINIDTMSMTHQENQGHTKQSLHTFWQLWASWLLRSTPSKWPPGRLSPARRIQAGACKTPQSGWPSRWSSPWCVWTASRSPSRFHWRHPAKERDRLSSSPLLWGTRTPTGSTQGGWSTPPPRAWGAGRRPGPRLRGARYHPAF